MNLAYIDTGTGVPVIFLHGVGSSKEIVTLFCDTFHNENYRVVAFDLPGHGDSKIIENPDYKNIISEMADIVVHNIEKLGIKEFVLVGISFGGTVAMEIVRNCPNKVLGLVLQGAPIHGKDLPFAARVPYKLFYRMRRPINGPKILYLFANSLAPFYEWMKGACKFSTALNKVRKNYSRKLDISFWALCVMASINSDVRQSLERFYNPILLIDGGIASYKFTNTSLKLAGLIFKNKTENILEIVWVPEAGHELPKTHPGEFAGHIVSFLGRNISKN